MTSELQPGAAFGEYVLERRLGAGGFGEVWLARDTGGSPVALKVMHGKYPTGETAKLRAEIELLAATASSRSSHIAQVLGGGGEPMPHVVMEFIEGTDLSHEIDTRGVLPIPEVVDVAEAIADALGTLQRAGIIHRDIKPGNVMIDSHGVVKLTDFGIAKIIGIDTVTATGQASMSMPYAAPEVWEGKATNLSDHYAFGVLLYQCLTGRVPFGGSYAEIYHQHIATAPDLDALPADTPPSLRRLIAGCLEKDAALRPQTARALQTAAAAAKAELASPGGVTSVRPLLQEPAQIGPWQIKERSATEAWVFVCRHETTGEETAIEVRFSDDLNDGAKLRQQFPSRSSRFILRPGDGWSNAPDSEFLFWVARASANASAPPAPVVDSQNLATSIAPVTTPPMATPPPIAAPPAQPISPRLPPAALPASAEEKRQPSMAVIAGAAVAAVVVVLGLAFALGAFGGKKENNGASNQAAVPPASASPAGAQATPAQPTTAPTQAPQPTTANAGAPAAPTVAPGTTPAAAPSAGGSIAIDGPAVTANIATPGQKAAFTFTGTAGQAVSVLTSGTSATLAKPCAYVGIVNATAISLGRILICSENGFLDQVSLPAAGTYTLTLEPLDNATGQMTLKLFNVTDVAGTIAVDGPAVLVNTTTPGQNARYTFNATSGQAVSVVITQISKPLGAACAYISVLSSLNVSQTKTLICGEKAFLDQVTLPTAGSYTLSLDPLDTGTGQATLTLLNVVDVAGTISIDGPAVMLSTTTPGQNARYTFNATAGQSVSVMMSKVSTPLAAACSYVSILDSLSTSLGKVLICSDSALEKVSLPATGAYSLIVDPLDAGTGQATLNLVTAK